jgi:glycosyltransferase involved in cell wall biosynthesis
MSSYSLVIPCYNEEAAIEQTLNEIRTALGPPESYELIVVNDGSQDRTSEVLERMAADDLEMEVVHHERNLGYGAAIKTGIRRASAELIAITDADGTYPNDRLEHLVSLCADADMVVGARTGENVQYSLMRKIPKILLKAYASWLTGYSIPDMNSGMRVFRKDIAEKYFNILPDGFSLTTTITMAMLANRYKVVFETISYSKRIGSSKIKPISDTLSFMQLILRTGMYFGPLKVFSPFIVVLFLAFLASFCYDVIVLSNLTDKTVLLLLFTMNTAMFALLADMIDKRSS